MKYLSVCSGIEAATVAWKGLGWYPVAFSEIETFPSAVLEHHYPNVHNLGDMTKINGRKYCGAVDLLVGGTPCQSFSVAGMRGGLEDARGQLSLHFVRLAQEVNPEWILWENVPGVLSSSKGQDFYTFVSALVEIGYHVAWRILDAQYFGVPQRRRRIFLVGHSGDWRAPAQVLFERESLLGNTKKSQGTRENFTTAIKRSSGDTEHSITCFNETWFSKYKEEPVCGCLTLHGVSVCNGSQCLMVDEGKQYTRLDSTLAPTLRSNCHGAIPVVLQEQKKRVYAIAANSIRENPKSGCNGKGYSNAGVMYTITTNDVHAVSSSIARRITPLEAERLQGFPDNYTKIPYRGKDASKCPDSHRYKAVGNSMAVPVMRWIGKRIMSIHDSKSTS